MASLGANWKKVKSWLYTAERATENLGKNKLEAVLYYNSDTINTTKVDIKFALQKLDSVGDTVDFYDTFYIILNPNDADSRELYWLKDTYTGASGTDKDYEKWPWIGSTYTITKSAGSKYITIPEFWFGNSGTYNGDKTLAEMYRLATTLDGGYWSKMRIAIDSANYYSDDGIPIPTPGSSPTITVEDKKNNTCLISGVLGKNGDNNKISSATLYYTTDGSDPKDSDTRASVSLTATTGGSYSKSVSITKACTVKAYVLCKFKHNTTSASAHASMKYYAKPSNSGKPYLVDSSFKNDRLTVKLDWGWDWGKATAANTDSPIKGYRVRLFVNDVNNPIVSYYTGETISTEIADNDWVYDRTSENFPMPMRAIDQDIIPGDTVKLSIQAYSVNGVGTRLLASVMTSDTYTVENAGIVHIKVGGSWKEGQVFTKVNGEWKEAETVNVKVSGAWKESQ